MDIEALVQSGQHREAVAACARQYGGSLGRVCIALLGSQDEAEEAVQETLLDAYKGMGGFRGDGSVKAWLYSIARRKCAQRLERRGRRSKLALVADTQVSATAVMSAKQQARQIRQALEKLKPSEREAVVLRYLSQLDYSEVAQAIGIDEPAARKRVSRGLASLRKVVGREDME